jgi:predicted patatin/cPLA2 family phospholipase
LRVRRETNSCRGKRSDPYHLALVIEGGGMRGVVSGGMISALEAEGFLPCFDSVHGSSAGACAGAYFIAGQARLGTQIYYEDVNNSRFINPWRPLIGRPIMNTHFLIDEVMRTTKPLDVGRVLATSGMLHVVATDAETGEGRTYTEFRDAAHFFSVLKGTITIPIIGGSAVDVDGAKLVDGGIVQQVAVRSAIDAGATHILVLMTRRDGELERPDRTWRLAVESLGLRILHHSKLAMAYERRNPGINKTLDFIRHPPPSLSIDSIVRPADALEIERLTISAALLIAADQEAQRAVLDYVYDAHDDPASSRSMRD